MRSAFQRLTVLAILAVAGLAFSAAQADAARVLSVRTNAPTCSCCQPTLTYLLEVCHHCTGCMETVEVCVPACCTDAPCAYERHTVLGCGATVFEWDCGERVVVRYWRRGGITVKYR